MSVPDPAAAKKTALSDMLKESPGGLAFPRRKVETTLVEGRLARLRARLRREGGSPEALDHWGNYWSSWDQWSDS